MRKKSGRSIALSEAELTFLFYIFMLLCGFIAGTRLWSTVSELKNIFVQPELADFRNSVLFIFVPSVILFGVLFFLGFFAGGWLLMPPLMYACGAFFGGFCCCIFYVEKEPRFEIRYVILAFALLCCAVMLSYFCVFAHRLSRELSGGGQNCLAAYKNLFSRSVLSLLIIAAVSALFSGLIYFTAV